MDVLSESGLLLVAAVFALGMRHGLDADHLAAVDGLTRFNLADNPRLARWCGTFFSLGHGAVVIAIALFVCVAAGQWQAPAWLGPFGAGVSILFLTVLGLLNLHAVLRADPAQVVHPVGLKRGLLGGLTRAASPGSVALVGVLFALSFDTVSQAAMFAVTSGQIGGWRHALMTGVAFMLGMLVVDGLNGLWISRLIRRADQTARIVSRTMGLVVAGISLSVAAYGAARLFAPELDVWSRGKEPVLGLVLVAVLMLAFVLALRLARTRPAGGVAD